MIVEFTKCSTTRVCKDIKYLWLRRESSKKKRPSCATFAVKTEAEMIMLLPLAVLAGKMRAQW